MNRTRLTQLGVQINPYANFQWWYNWAVKFAIRNGLPVARSWSPWGWVSAASIIKSPRFTIKSVYVKQYCVHFTTKITSANIKYSFISSDMHYRKYTMIQCTQKKLNEDLSRTISLRSLYIDTLHCCIFCYRCSSEYWLCVSEILGCRQVADSFF